MYDLDFENDSKLARQIHLESEMIGMSQRRLAERVSKAVEKQTEASTTYGRILVSSAVDRTAEVLDNFVSDYTSGKAIKGRPHIALKYLKQVGDMRVVAYLTARTVLNGVSRGTTLVTTANAVARSLEDEVAFRTMAEEVPALWKWLRKEHSSNTLKHQRRVFRVAAQHAEDMHWNGWEASDRTNLGVKCIECLIQATGLVQIDTVMEKGRKKNYLRATQATMDWIEKNKEAAAVLMPMYLPMIVPPKDLEGPYGGGYYSTAIRPLKLIKTYNRNLLEELKNRKDQMTPVYDAINALQRTAWRINPKILEVMTEAWEAGSDIGKLPTSKELPMPPKPGFLTDTWKLKGASEQEQVEFRRWKDAKHSVHVAQVAANSKRLSASAMLNVARKFADEPEIFFPYTMDFRGRTYPVTKFLDPQGDDRSKALIEFAHGDPIEEQEQADWLAIHGANTWGNDKVALDERVMWAYMVADQVKAVAADPWENQMWVEADKPWQFLAWCFEWAAFLEEGYGYVSRIPVAMDGSCNGLQHFSAMLRDPIGGRAVNLLPSERPQDIYRDVAARTLALLQAFIEQADPVGDAENLALARKWESWGITRKDTKRSVMIVPYSGTIRACQAYIHERIHERIAEGEEDVWGDDKFKAAVFLAKQVWSAIDSTVVAARGAMNWLQDVAKVLSKEKLPIHWTTPDGFVVHQDYRKYSAQRVQTKLDGACMPRARKLDAQGRARLDTSIAVPTTEIDTNRQRNGIAPNFVHSLDATAMRLTVRAASQQGVDSFAMIHDSFGTTAAKTPLLARVLREEFVKIYTERDVLQEFKDEVGLMLDLGTELPEIPPSGDLEITDVLKSAFFFA